MKSVRRGNLLGSSRAETDTFMLDRAFIATADYASLTKTNDFNFVVGRRGTGKSALFRKVADYFSHEKRVLLVRAVTQEEEAMSLQNALQRFPATYAGLRTVARIAWKVNLLLEAATLLQRHYRTREGVWSPFLADYFRKHRDVVGHKGLVRCANIIGSGTTTDSRAATAAIAQDFDVESLKFAVQQSLADGGLTAVYLYDGLDEGWTPEVLPTAVVGGLAKAASELVEGDVGVYPIIFVRDNMFRALGELDTDFTRHIEGSTIRLHWEERSLLNLVAARLRVALELDLENDVKVWNRFAQKGLEGLDGFRSALQQTLYRPRDILTLLNDAYQLSSREGRSAIIDTDLHISADRISKARLDDLIKEYNRVFPGLKLFAQLFAGGRSIWRVAAVWDLLDQALSGVVTESSGGADFALFTDAKEVFFALYSVGFMGVAPGEAGPYTFCHDGSLTSPQDIGDQWYATIHPCYWRALHLSVPDDSAAVVVQINDEHDVIRSPDVQQLRTKLLGTIAEELPRMPTGADGARDFEKWVLRAVKILFDGRLTNAELKPNPGALQQRDVVATNVAERGFWKRIYGDYRTRQVIFECKNYQDLTADDFRQVLSYTTGEYGKFAVIVTRAEREYASELEAAWLRELYNRHDQRVVLIMPAELLARALKKLRNQSRNIDYTEQLFGKRMDDVVRRVLSLPHGRRYRPRKHRRVTGSR